MRVNVQQAQESRRVAAEGLQRHQSVYRIPEWAEARGWKTLSGVSMTVAFERATEDVRSITASTPRWTELPPGVVEQLAKCAQENGLQHLCACSARSLSPYWLSGKAQP